MNLDKLLKAIYQVNTLFLNSSKSIEHFLEGMLKTFLELTESDMVLLATQDELESGKAELNILSFQAINLQTSNYIDIFQNLIEKYWKDKQNESKPHSTTIRHFTVFYLPTIHQANLLVALANRPTGYEENFWEMISPFALTCNALLQSLLYQTEQLKKDTLNEELLQIERRNNEHLAVKEEELSATEEELRQTNHHLLEANELLQESEKKYKYLFENNPVPMWIYEIETLRFLDVNQTAVVQYGYSKEEFLQMTLLDIRSSSEAKRLQNYLNKGLSVLNNSQVWKHIKKNGEEIFVEVVGHSFEYEGKPARLVLSNNITERIQAEKQLFESETNLKAIFNHSVSFKFLIDKNYRILKANQPALDDLKKNFNELNPIGKSIFQIVVPEKREKFTQILQRCFKGELVEDEEFVTLPSGKEMWLQAFYTPITDEEQEITKILMSVYDITERKLIYLDLMRTNEILKSLLDNLPVMISLFDSKGEFVFCNETWVKTLGYTLDEMVGKDMLSLYYPNEEDRTKALEFMLSGRKGWEDFKTTIKSGKIIDTSWANVRLSNGNTIGIGQDITVRKQIEEKLAHQNSQLLEFAFLTSHKLRRPLANILGLISLFDFDNLQSEFNATVLQKLLIPSKELDEIIYQMNQLLESSENSITKD